MNKNTKNNEIPAKALELLPWFAIGGLSSNEEKYFQEALSRYPDLQQLLDQELEMKRLVSKDKTLLDISALEPIEERLKSVWNQIDSIAVSKPENTQESSSLVSKLKGLITSWLPNDLRLWHYSSVASALVLVVSVSVFMAFIAPLFNQENSFTPASAVTSEVNNPVSTTILLVGFNGSPEELGAYPALEDKLVNVEAVSNKKGMFKVSLNEKLDEAKTKELIDVLMAQKELVWFAGEAF